MLKRFDSSPRTFAIIYGAVGSIVASALWALSPAVLDWLSSSTWGIFVRFINRRLEAAATLEPVNYSFFVLTVIFIIAAILWFEIAGRLKKALLGSVEPVPIAEVKALSRTTRLVAYGFMQLWVSLYFALMLIVGQVTTLNAMSGFNQHMRIVAPYVTQDESRLLLSKWSQMRTTEDYDAINERIAQIAKANSLRLPRSSMF
jgi:hypothetical protein